MPSFQNPAAFLLLIFVPLLYIVRYLKIFSGISFPLTFCDWNGERFEWLGGIHGILSAISEFILALSYVCAVIALASPVVRNQEKIYTSRGADIAFVIDTSPSMAAKDIASGTRLEAAKQVVKQLVQQNAGTSFALVAMASEAAVVVPPTIDHNAFLQRLEQLSPGEMGDGSAIGTGLTTAVYHLISSLAPKKCIVLVTDGENNAGEIHPNTAARLARDNGISLYVLGLGTRGMVSLEYVDKKSGRVVSGYLDSAFDTEQLREIAYNAGGSYFSVENMGEFSSIVASIAKEQIFAQSYHIKSSDSHFSPAFLLSSLILASLAWILRRLYLKELL